MSLLKILTFPKSEPFLRQKSLDLDQSLILSEENQIFFDDLINTMRQVAGAGLAAPQVNHAVRVITVSLSEKQTLLLINPVITRHSFSKKTHEEGCLSVPGVFGQVKRHKSIKVKYFNRAGQKQIQKFRDLPARIIQHEIDHLDGILFIDKIVIK